MLPSNQLSPSLNPYYWSPSHHPARRFRELPLNPTAPPAVPAVEPCYFYESGDGEAYLDVELPGVKKRHIAVEVSGTSLCVTAKRFRLDRDAYPAHSDISPQPVPEHDLEQDIGEEEAQEPDVSFVYSLRMRLGADADAERIVARRYQDGILTLAIPIKAALVTRKIPLQI